MKNYNNEILNNCAWFAEKHRGKNKQSGAHWSTIIRFPKLFDEAARLQQRVDTLEAYIADYCQEQRWVPVSEREPEENRYVLVTDGKQVFEAKCYKKYDELKWVWQGYDIDENIAHWMLKPQPPKEVTK